MFKISKTEKNSHGKGLLALNSPGSPTGHPPVDETVAKGQSHLSLILVYLKNTTLSPPFLSMWENLEIKLFLN